MDFHRMLTLLVDIMQTTVEATRLVGEEEGVPGLLPGLAPGPGPQPHPRRQGVRGVRGVRGVEALDPLLGVASLYAIWN